MVSKTLRDVFRDKRNKEFVDLHRVEQKPAYGTNEVPFSGGKVGQASFPRAPQKDPDRPEEDDIVAQNPSAEPAHEDVSEGLRLLQNYTNSKGYRASVHRDAEWNEYRVKFHHPETGHMKNADYHTNDKEDAHDTAKAELRRLNEDEVNEISKSVLGRYVKRAVDDVEDMDSDYTTLSKRKKGIDRAVDRLTGHARVGNKNSKDEKRGFNRYRAEEVELQELSANVESGNKKFGYYGTVHHQLGSHEQAKEAYSRMHYRIKKALGEKDGANDVKVGHYLDSAHGRLLAGRVGGARNWQEHAKFIKTDFKRFEKKYNPKQFASEELNESGWEGETGEKAERDYRNDKNYERWRKSKAGRAEYNKDSVDRAIKSSRQKIGGKEAKLIHSLLKGRTK